MGKLHLQTDVSDIGHPKLIETGRRQGAGQLGPWPDSNCRVITKIACGFVGSCEGAKPGKVKKLN